MQSCMWVPYYVHQLNFLDLKVKKKSLKYRIEACFSFSILMQIILMRLYF